MVHEEDHLCLPSGSAGSFLGKATSTTDYWSTANQTNKQTAASRGRVLVRLPAIPVRQHLPPGLMNSAGRQMPAPCLNSVRVRAPVVCLWCFRAGGTGQHRFVYGTLCGKVPVQGRLAMVVPLQ